MTMILSAHSIRVLGSLMEKEMTTPDTYPMSLNGLVAAANQRSSRDPVMDLDEQQVRAALADLETESLVVQARDGGRVAKYEHRIRTVLNLRRDETAVLCLLLLRGAQTPGELRSRSERLFSFEDLGQIQGTLERLQTRERPLVSALARVPGSREVRWAHLLGDPAAMEHPTVRESHSDRPSIETHTSQESETLRAALSALALRVESLEKRLDQLETQPNQQAALDAP